MRLWSSAAPWTLLLSGPLLIAGWVLPILSVTSFWVFETEHSIYGGLVTFFKDGEWLLILIIGAFAVLFPAGKVMIGIFGKEIHAMNRWGEPSEIARAVLFLASDEASFCTGHNMVIDGGWTIGKRM